MQKQLIQHALDLLGTPTRGTSFPCPNTSAHKNGDRSPSAGYFGDGLRWKCLACDAGGDALDLVMLAKGIDFTEAKHFLGLTGQSPAPTRPTAARASKPGRKTIIVRGQRITINTTPDEPIRPDLRHGTDEEIEQLSKLRGISAGALRFAMRWGVLRFGDVANVGTFWCMTDASGHATEARRLDGEPWPKTGKRPWAFAGSRKDWPLALTTGTPADSCRVILLTEGPPDCLAALEMIAIAGRGDVLPVAMLGSSATLGAEALRVIGCRPVVIWADDDDPGREAAARWGEELRSAGSPVRAFLPPVGKDVNDWLRCNPTREEVRAALPSFTTEGGCQ